MARLVSLKCRALLLILLTRLMIRRISGGTSKRIRLLHKAVVQMYWTLVRQALSYKGYFSERSTTRLIIRFSLHTATALEYPALLPPWLRCGHSYAITPAPLVCTLRCISP